MADLDDPFKRNAGLLDPGNLPWPPDGTIAAEDRAIMLEFYFGAAPAVDGIEVVLRDPDTLVIPWHAFDEYGFPTKVEDVFSLTVHVSDLLVLPPRETDVVVNRSDSTDTLGL